MPKSGRPHLFRIVATIAISSTGGLAATLVGVPAGWIAGGLLAVAAASLAGLETTFPKSWEPPVFLLLGI